MSNSPSVSDTTQNDSVVLEKKETVAYETFAKLLNETKKTKELNKELLEEKRIASEKKLLDEKNYKELYESSEKRAKENEDRANKVSEELNNGLKINRFEKVLGGKIDPVYYGHIPFEKMIIDAETGAINEDSIKLAASDFAKKHPKLIEFSVGKMPNLAGKQFDGNGSKNINNMTSEELQNQLRMIAGSEE